MEDRHGVENPPTITASKLKTMNCVKTQFDKDNPRDLIYIEMFRRGQSSND